MGYEEGGQLTEAVRRKPFSVVLFDEIEKAHPDVFNALLQILEDGRLTDSQGRTRRLQEHRHHHDLQPGHGRPAQGVGRLRQDQRGVTYEKMKEKVNDALKAHFRPEFLNRIDDVIVFHELTKDEVTEIIDLMIKRVRNQLESQGLGLELTQAAKYLVVEKGYDPTLGRPAAAPGPPAAGRGSRSPRRSCGRSSGPARRSSSTSNRPEAGEPVIVFRAIEGLEPPPVELAGAGSGE